MKRFPIFVACTLLFVSLVSCKPAVQTNEPSSPSDLASTETVTLSYEEELSAFQAFSAKDILVYVRPVDGGKRVYKTFSEKREMQDILAILNASDIHTSSESQEATAGWTLLIRIWPDHTGNDVAHPFLVSFSGAGASYVDLGGYKYTVEKNDCYDRLLAFFEASSIEEKPYT